MFHESRRIIVTALASGMVIVITAVLLADGVERANPDRDITRVERVTDVQLPTL